MRKLYSDEHFRRIDFVKDSFSPGEYENCIFDDCNFREVNLSGVIFRECTFRNCDMSMMCLVNTTLHQVCFESCKILGVAFNQCNPLLLSPDFYRSQLAYSVFGGLKLRNRKFQHCDLTEVDFSDADLEGVVFGESKLDRSLFLHTNLECADFSTASNYIINPVANRLKNARFSQTGLSGLLQEFNIIIE